MIRLHIDTTDPEFLKDLQSAKNMQGIRISRRIEASGDGEWVLLTVQIAVAIAPLFIEWLTKRLPQKTAHKTTVNNVDVSHDARQIETIIYQQINIYQDKIAHDNTSTDKRRPPEIQDK